MGEVQSWSDKKVNIRLILITVILNKVEIQYRPYEINLDYF